MYLGPQKLVIAALTLLLTIGAAAQASNQPQPDLATIVHKMEQAQVAAHENVRPYVVTREYRFFEGDEKSQPDSQVTAQISYLPPSTKQFSIQDSKGSGRGERVVKKVLEHEQQMATSWQQSAITDENYRFSYLGQETLNGRRCFVLGLEPRRDSKELLKGRAWVDAENYRIHRVTGEPAKSPSWWIKRLEITLLFGNVQGMWLQTVSHADADVRMFGHNVLTARDVSYQTGEMVATRRNLKRPQRAVGAGILVVR
jgi:outer membrane lipoprotein-sorting protein